MRRVMLLPTALLGCASALACEHPSLVQIPPDAAERVEEVRAAVADYVAAMQLYADCIRAELDAALAEQAPELTQRILVRRNNAAVEEVQAVIDLFYAATGEQRRRDP